MAPPKGERRRHPRFRIPPKFRVKARVKFLKDGTIHYLEVDNLSMGGAQLKSQPESTIDVSEGDTLEIMMFRENLSLRCVAKVVQAQEVKDSKKTKEAEQMVMSLGLQLVGIDEKSYKRLAEFLEQIATTEEARLAKELPKGAL